MNSRQGDNADTSIFNHYTPFCPQALFLLSAQCSSQLRCLCGCTSKCVLSLLSLSLSFPQFFYKTTKPARQNARVLACFLLYVYSNSRQRLSFIGRQLLPQSWQVALGLSPSTRTGGRGRVAGSK